MPYIHIISNEGRIYNYPILKDIIAIGRHNDNDIVLHDNTVSRNHAQILKTKKGYLLNDLGSFNGTKVNDNSVQSALLRNEDRIRIGLNKITFLTKEKEIPSLPESLILSRENDYEKDVQKILKSSPQETHVDSETLLVSLEAEKGRKKTDFGPPAEEKNH